MWIDLNTEQKAEVMKMAVASGLRDLDAIKEMYDISIVDNDNIYAGGSKKSKSGIGKAIRKAVKMRGTPALFYQNNYGDPRYTNSRIDRRNLVYRGPKKMYIDPRLSPYEALKAAGIYFVTSNPYLRTGQYNLGAGKYSHHRTPWKYAKKNKEGKIYSNAVDLSPMGVIYDEKTKKNRPVDFSDLWEQIFNHPGLMYWAAVNGYGFIDETGWTPWEKTGPHIHFGPDSKSMNSVYHPLFSTYFKPSRYYGREMYPFYSSVSSSPSSASAASFIKSASSNFINDAADIISPSFQDDYDAAAEAQKMIGPPPQNYITQYEMPVEFQNNLMATVAKNNAIQAEALQQYMGLMEEQQRRQQNNFMKMIAGMQPDDDKSDSVDSVMSFLTQGSDKGSSAAEQILGVKPDLSWMNVDRLLNPASMVAGGGQLYQKGGKKNSERWKALNNIDYTAVPDKEFTRDKTGAGSIEYFSKEHPDGITYPNGFHRDHPSPGNDVILYNPNDNDTQDIELDALHIMPKDLVFKILNDRYRDSARNSDLMYFAKQRRAEDWVAQLINSIKRQEEGYPVFSDSLDNEEQYFNNEADGLLRNMLIEAPAGADPVEYMENKRYYPYKKDLQVWYKDLMPDIGAIQKYLETGQYPNMLPEVVSTGKKAYGGNLHDDGRGFSNPYMENWNFMNADRLATNKAVEEGTPLPENAYTSDFYERLYNTNNWKGADIVDYYVQHPEREKNLISLSNTPNQVNSVLGWAQQQPSRRVIYDTETGDLVSPKQYDSATKGLFYNDANTGYLNMRTSPDPSKYKYNPALGIYEKESFGNSETDRYNNRLRENRLNVIDPNGLVPVRYYDTIQYVPRSKVNDFYSTHSDTPDPINNAANWSLFGAAGLGRLALTEGLGLTVNAARKAGEYALRGADKLSSNLFNAASKSPYFPALRSFVGSTLGGEAVNEGFKAATGMPYGEYMADRFGGNPIVWDFTNPGYGAGAARIGDVALHEATTAAGRLGDAAYNQFMKQPSALSRAIKQLPAFANDYSKNMLGIDFSAAPYMGKRALTTATKGLQSFGNEFNMLTKGLPASYSTDGQLANFSSKPTLWENITGGLKNAKSRINLFVNDIRSKEYMLRHQPEAEKVHAFLQTGKRTTDIPASWQVSSRYGIVDDAFENLRRNSLGRIAKFRADQTEGNLRKYNIDYMDNANKRTFDYLQNDIPIRYFNDEVFSEYKNIMSHYLKGRPIGLAMYGENPAIAVRGDLPYNKARGITEHEIRHMMDKKGKNIAGLTEYVIGRTPEEQAILDKAYGKMFRKAPIKHGKVPRSYDMESETVTTNLDARNGIKELPGMNGFDNLSIEEQNMIIDKLSDEQILKLVEKANGYGKSFIQELRKTDPEEIQQRIRYIRDALKYIGEATVPAGILAEESNA